MHLTNSLTTMIIEAKAKTFIHMIKLNGTELKNALKICVNKICIAPVNKITLIANLFFIKFGMILSVPNSRHLKALNKALKAKIENITVPISAIKFSCNKKTRSHIAKKAIHESRFFRLDQTKINMLT